MFRFHSSLVFDKICSCCCCYSCIIAPALCNDTGGLLLLEMLYSFFLSFFFFFHFPTFSCARFFSVETSAINLKLQHKVETGPSSNRNIFLEIRPTVPELEKSVGKKENAASLSITEMTLSRCSCTVGMPITTNRGVTMRLRVHRNM